MFKGAKYRFNVFCCGELRPGKLDIDDGTLCGRIGFILHFGASDPLDSR
jgi:hypothetical protein